MLDDGPGFIDRLPPEARDTLLAAGVRRRFQPGRALFVEGDRSERVIALVRGRVKITSTSPDGRESVLALVSSGELIGELAAIDGVPRSASAIALEPVDAVVIPAPEFERFLSEHSGAAMFLLRTVVARLRESDRRRAEFGAYQAPARVAARLLDLAEQHGRPAPSAGPHAVMIDAPVTQDDIAGLAGASREAVAKALAELRRSGLITTTRRCVTVIDPTELRRRAPW